ncbi:imidazole glycerol phosphate synthase subunit HisF [Candidatus Peregrinibacteria bacterium]|nr:imidazole glycerol phosphate synthase subunit HisF [Candidatus Peregrinibacteria bacterium]
MEVIPAIDLLDGQVVRLRQGNFDSATAYPRSPLALAQSYQEQGANWLHLVNLSSAKDSARDPRQMTFFCEIVRVITTQTNLRLQAGGGIRSLGDIAQLLNAGASSIVLGTLLFEDPSLVLDALTLFGREKFIAALDIRNNDVRIRGWKESAAITLDDAIRNITEMGMANVLITDIDRDGMMVGPNVDLYERLTKFFPELSIIASGGVRNVEDIRNLDEAGCGGAVIGKALCEGTVSLRELLRSYDNETEKHVTPSGVEGRHAGDMNDGKNLRSGLAIRVIPCLDVSAGRVVKGTRFHNLRDAGDPVELAGMYCEEGADELVFLDITATAEERQSLFDLIGRVAEVVNIPFTVGGGVRSVDDARKILEAGADKVAVNSAAVWDSSLLSDIAEELGSANTVCAIDAKRKVCHPELVEGWVVLTRGGRDDAGRDAVAWADEAVERGAGELLVTSYDRDGTGTGFDCELLAAIKNRVSVPVIASGGGGSLKSFVEAVRLGKADAVLAASVFHFGQLSIRQVKAALADASFQIRL